MLIVVDTGSPEPVFRQIAAGVAAQVASGAIAHGERLPAARDLAESLGVNLHTVLRAYQALRDDGMIELRRGRGAVVIGRPASGRLRDAVAAAATEARASGVGLGTLIALIRKEYPS